MNVSFQHLCQVIIGSAKGHLGLDQDLHAFHYVLTSQVVESHFTLDVIVDLKGFGTFSNFNWFLVGHTHVLSEWDPSILFNELFGLKSIVEVLFHFMESRFDLCNVVNFSLAELFELSLLKLRFSHIFDIVLHLVICSNFFITVIGLLIDTFLVFLRSFSHLCFFGFSGFLQYHLFFFSHNLLLEVLLNLFHFFFAL